MTRSEFDELRDFVNTAGTTVAALREQVRDGHHSTAALEATREVLEAFQVALATIDARLTTTSRPTLTLVKEIGCDDA
jgi:hypothetical protein